MCNTEIRVAMVRAGLKHYQVAEAMGVADESFSRWLRHELPEDRQKQIMAVIKQLAKERK